MIEINKKYPNYRVLFDKNTFEIKTLYGVDIDGWNGKFIYTGMVHKITNKPHGFGRAVNKNYELFIDG